MYSYRMYRILASYNIISLIICISILAVTKLQLKIINGNKMVTKESVTPDTFIVMSHHIWVAEG